MGNINIEGIRKYFSSQPIERVWLFGSYARGTERPDSDIDLLVKFENEATIGLITLSRIVMDLKEIVEKDVDLVVDGTLFPWIEEKVEKDKILIYERV